MKIRLISYGDDGLSPCIVKLDSTDTANVSSIQLVGKANMVIETDLWLITSIKEADRTSLVIYDKDGNIIDRIHTKYFYSYGFLKNDYLVLASFTDGVDSSFHIKTKKWKHQIHERANTELRGRSHYIQDIEDKIISIDNALQQIYVYTDASLKEVKVIDFEENINLRLASYNALDHELYINTEITNEIIVLNSTGFNVLNRFELTHQNHYFSGGNAYDAKRHLICISMRGENAIYVVEKTGKIHAKLKTKKLPRDLKIIDDKLCVTCFEEDCVEIFDLDAFAKIQEIKVSKPATFSL